MAKRTPSSPILRSVAAFSSKFCMRTRSVTSSSRRRPSRLCAARHRFTLSTNKSPCASSERGMEEAEAGATAILRVVHGGVGVLEELGEVTAVARIQRDADRGADGERAAFDGEGPAEDREQPLAERSRLLARLEPVPQEYEVVP